MCCGGKCLFFINLRTGSLIFGYISAVISALGTIACTIAAMIFLVLVIFPYNYERSMSNIQPLISITPFFIEFLSGFICSVLLLIGIKQNKPSLVKTYIIYGMLQIVLLFVFFIIVHCITSFFLAGYLMLAVGILGLYTMCLYMIFLIYQPMTREQEFVNPQNILIHSSVNSA